MKPPSTSDFRFNIRGEFQIKMNAIAHATEVPTVGIFVQVPLNQRKDERNRAQLDKKLKKNAGEDGVKSNVLAAGDKR
jgi:hypothetical protein